MIPERVFDKFIKEENKYLIPIKKNPKDTKREILNAPIVLWAIPFLLFISLKNINSYFIILNLRNLEL